jgi:hypothetical protein
MINKYRLFRGYRTSSFSWLSFSLHHTRRSLSLFTPPPFLFFNRKAKAAKRVQFHSIIMCKARGTVASLPRYWELSQVFLAWSRKPRRRRCLAELKSVPGPTTSRPTQSNSNSIFITLPHETRSIPSWTILWSSPLNLNTSVFFSACGQFSM